MIILGSTLLTAFVHFLILIAIFCSVTHTSGGLSGNLSYLL